MSDLMWKIALFVAAMYAVFVVAKTERDLENILLIAKWTYIQMEKEMQDA